jgi:hypothetical protein
VSERKPWRLTTSIEALHRLRNDKREELRHTMTLPVRVTGVDRHKGEWTELAETVNVSSGGAALRLSKRVMLGDILFLELRLPARLQKKADASAPFKTSALVRYVEMRGAGQQIVRLQFLRNPNRVN